MVLPTDGDTVNITRKDQQRSIIREKYFGGKGAITRGKLESKLKELLKKIDIVPDAHVVALVVVYIFTTILFPQSNGNVPVQLFSYVDNLETLWEYNWGKAVYQMLRDSIPGCALWVQLMEHDHSYWAAESCEPRYILESQHSIVGGNHSKKNRIKRGPKRKDKLRGSLPGCAIGLLVILSILLSL
jgi:hypothetical protein